MLEYNAHQLSQQIKLLRKYLKLKITEDKISFTSFESERRNVYDLIERCVLHGESHSALIIGPRGCGKTTLINSVLHQISKEADLVNDAVIIKLNGLVHHDDKVALKSITAQMQLVNTVGDRVFGSFAENLSFLLSCLVSGADRRCKSMVFVLEEFDLFCHSTHTQTLLYNLFEITHSKQAPMCVLGVTNHNNVMELLEKRVKSRFSYRHIFMFYDHRAGTQHAVSRFRLRLLECLSVSLSETKHKSSRRKSSQAIESNVGIQPVPDAVLTKCKTDKKQFLQLESCFLEDWNCHIQSLVNDQKVEDSLEKFCYYTVNEQVFQDILFQTVSKLSPKRPYIDAAVLSGAIAGAVSPEHRVQVLQSLSVLELSLVIAMLHGMAIFDGQPMNFEMVLHRYTKFVNANSSAQSVPRSVVLKAFEHLQQLQVITPSKNAAFGAGDSCTSRVHKEYKLYALSAPAHDVQRAVAGYRALPTELAHWLNNY